MVSPKYNDGDFEYGTNAITARRHFYIGSGIYYKVDKMIPYTTSIAVSPKLAAKTQEPVGFGVRKVRIIISDKVECSQ